MQVVAGRGRHRARAQVAARDRGKASFADARVYLERYVAQPRHIEVQVFCDDARAGLRARRARVQRAAPPPEDRRGVAVAGVVLRGRGGRGSAASGLYDAALRVVKKVGYVGAGTCEFIADDAGQPLLPRGERAPPGRAPRDRDGDRARSRRAAAPRRRWREAARPRRTSRARATRSRRASTPRIRARGSSRSRGRSTSSTWAGGAGEVQSRALRIESGVAAGIEGDAVLRSDDREDGRVGRDARRGDRRARSRARGHDARAARRRTSSFLRKVLASEEFRAGRYDTKFAEVLAKRP